MGVEWLAGVALSIVGNVLSNLGTNVMKLGHNRRLQLPSPHPEYKDRAWQGGLVLYGAGNIAMFLSFGYAAQSILAAIGALQFISNVVFASLVLKETATHHIITATGLIVAGCVLIVVFGSHSSQQLDVQQLLNLYAGRAYIIYLALGTAAVVAAYALYALGERVLRANQSRQLALWAAVMPVLWSLFSALVCTQSLIFNKAVMVLWRMTLAGDNQFNKWATWIMILGFILTAGLWVVQLNKGLLRFPALIIVPCMQLCWTLFGVISGLLYFQEYAGMTRLQVAMFVLGVAVVCVGAGTLARAPHRDHAAAVALHAGEQPPGKQAAPQGGACEADMSDSQGPGGCLGADFSLQVVWTSTDSDSVRVAHVPYVPGSFASISQQSGATAQPGLAQPPLFEMMAPVPAAQTGPPLAQQWSVDAAATVARRGNRHLSRLRTCSLPTQEVLHFKQ